MKVYLSTETLGENSWEQIEVKHRFNQDEKCAAPAHSILRKAERLAIAIKRGGVAAKVVICPESAAELMRLMSEGCARINQLWHFEYVKPSKAKTRALAKLVKLVNHERLS